MGLHPNRTGWGRKHRRTDGANRNVAIVNSHPPDLYLVLPKYVFYASMAQTTTLSTTMQPFLPTRQRGFNLIELLIVLVVSSIVLTLAAPSFNDMLQRNRLAGEANELLTAVATARANALRAASPARFCSSSDGLTCGGTWNDGWLVAVDTNRDNSVDADEVVAVGDNVSGVARAGASDTLLFDLRGRASNFSLTVSAESCVEGKAWQYQLRVYPTGGADIINQECP